MASIPKSAIPFVRSPQSAIIITACDPEILEVTDEAHSLVEAYLGHGILTEKFRNDMLHIAITTVHAVDILVSWNYKHIVRFDNIVRFNAVNLEYGHRQIMIHSPREVTTYEKD